MKRMIPSPLPHNATKAHAAVMTEPVGHLVDLGDRPPLLTVKEVVEITRLSRSTVYAMLDAHEIVSVKMGESVRVPKAALESYLRRCVRGA